MNYYFQVFVLDEIKTMSNISLISFLLAGSAKHVFRKTNKKKEF
jgi:hypothetical protein